MNEIIKRYNIGMSIINNNQGVKTMKLIKAIYNKISNIIDSMFEKVGYHLIGYKVDIEQNQDDIKAIREYKVGLHKFKTLKNDVSDLKDDIKAVEICVNLAKEEHEKLKNVHNNLAFDVRERLLKLEDFELRTLKEKAEKVLNLENEFDEKENAFRLANKLIDTPFKDDDNLDNCANDVIKLVNKYHYLVDNNGVGGDDDYFIDDVKRLITKHINLTK